VVHHVVRPASVSIQVHVRVHSYLHDALLVGEPHILTRDMGGTAVTRDMGGTAVTRDMGGTAVTRDMGGTAVTRDMGGTPKP
jgi:hypothetical protein